MSSKGIYTAVSGANAQMQRLDTIANNIANANTTSFKKDQQVFKEYLTANEKEPSHIRVPRITASVESFYDMQGGDRGYVDAQGTHTQMTQGGLRQTGSTLDVAIEGKGFFEVLTPQGVRWTRNGSFHMNERNQLATKEGHLVLREGLQEPEQRAITLQSPSIVVTPSGEIQENGETIGRFSLVDIADTDGLQKVGQSLYKIKANNIAPLLLAEGMRLHQGALEISNVNVVEEMTDMIQATRVFETLQKAVQAFDKMDEKLISEAGKL